MKCIEIYGITSVQELIQINNRQGLYIAVYHLHLLKALVQTRKIKRSPRIAVLESYYK